MVPIIVTGLRLGQPERDRNWDFNRARWKVLGWPVIEGHHDEPGPFCMSVASNRAFRYASNSDIGWDVALYVGADFALGDLSHAEEAIEMAWRCKQFTVAHSHTTMLTEDGTNLVAAGQIELGDAEGERYPNPFTGIVAFPRRLFEEVGGFDERFVGWGWEDQAFWAACMAFGEGFCRVEGEAYHLWHPASRADKEESPTYWANEELGRRYLAARTSRQQTLQIIGERQ